MSWWSLLGMAAITFLNRYAFFADSISYQPGTRVRKFLSFSSYAILTAIWTPIMFSFNPTDGFSHSGPAYLIAGLLAACLNFLKIRNIIVVLTSTVVFFLLRLVF